MTTTLATAALALGTLPIAAASPEQDRQFANIVQQLGVPANSPEEAGQVGTQICTTLEQGMREPTATVRALIGQFTSKGLEKPKSVALVRGAVEVYCPQYRAILGR